MFRREICFSIYLASVLFQVFAISEPDALQDVIDVCGVWETRRYI